MTNTQAFAWAAGLFEGEGTISFGVSPQLRLTMTDEEVVRRFAETIGEGGICEIPAQQHNWRHAWCWYKAGRRVEEIVGKLWPFLGERRRTQIMDVLRRYDVYLADQCIKRTRTCEACGEVFLSGYNKHAARWCRACWRSGRNRRS